MKKNWLKIVVLLIVIWAGATAYSLLNGSSTTHSSEQQLAEKEKPKLFKLVKDQLALEPSPKIKAQSAIVFDLDSGKIIMQKNEETIRSIASLTKLATALVFRELKIDLDKTMVVTREDREGAGRSRLRIGSQVKVRDLLHLMLISSDNVAGRVVARATGLTSEQFVARMNALAISLGMMHTHFADPTGLNPANMSTAAEFSILLKSALDDKLISEILSKKEYSFRPINGRRTYTLHNTNRLLFGKRNILGGKTGFIGEAGYCLAIGAEVSDGRKLGAVLLGSPSSGSRFRDAIRLLTSIEPEKPANL